jgi:succinate-acetate transporter protein
MCGPVIISAAIFVSIVFLDLFRHEYKRVPVHAILGVFAVVLMSFLCETNRIFIAWILLFIPFIILGAGIMIRNHKMQSISRYYEYNMRSKKLEGAPFFL